MERDTLSSSDEEDDRQALVHQNEAKSPHSHPHPHPHPRRSAFEISHLVARIGRGLGPSHKRYLLAICLPLVLILLFFALDLRRIFHGASLAFADSPSDRMREAELRALYLLRNQQLGLLHLWNRSLASIPPASSNAAPSPTSSPTITPNPTPVFLNDFRSALLEQIKLNKQIQKALLSTHRPVNTSTSSSMFTNSSVSVDPDQSGSVVDVCRKLERPEVRKAIEWRPRKDRYLFAICLSGQMSNHLICLEKHMFVAALLDRILVLPSPKFDYDYDQVLDIKHINDCFGRKVVVPFSEFTEMKRNRPRIDRFICYIASPPCYLDEEHIKKLKGIGISVEKIEPAWPEDANLKTQKKRVAGDITAKFGSNDEVIAVGDLFYSDLEEEWVMQPGGPLAHKCKTVIQPSRLIILTAQRFVQTFLGSNFIALHFRRHGFLKFCNMKKESCFFPVPQAAECISRVVERANVPVIYLSTDAAESETNLLQSLVLLNDRQVPLVKRPSHTSVEKWDALLYRNHLNGDSQVEAMLDKTICAMSSAFIGSPGSTFTDDIIRLRRGWGSASQCDEFLCQGERPNYIAESE